MSVHLTDPKEYEGGELNLINYSNYPIMVNNNLGSTIVFDSRIPHKVCLLHGEQGLLWWDGRMPKVKVGIL